MLAMVAQSPRAFRQPALSLTTIASMLAPTEEGVGKKRPEPVGAFSGTAQQKGITCLPSA